MMHSRDVSDEFALRTLTRHSHLLVCAGSLDANELTAVFTQCGKTVSVGTVSNMLRLADEDGTGTISFEEFATIVNAI